jgi:hypothetical protein
MLRGPKSSEIVAVAPRRGGEGGEGGGGSEE